MNKFVWLIVLNSSLLFSYTNFSKKELNKLEQIAQNRIADYKKNVKLFKTYDKNRQLKSMNTYLNQLLPKIDSINQKQEDYWETPKEFLALGYGDCEDYVIIKYFTLLNMGFKEKDLYITTAYEKFSGGYHMVLTYFKEKNQPPLILDNLSFRILNLKARTDLKIDYFINKYGVYRINKNNKLKKIAKGYTPFKNLMKRINKNL